MAKTKETKASDDEDESKPLTTLRIDPILHQPVRRGCKKLVMNPTTLVNQAVREFLERHKLWPLEAIESEDQ